MLDKPYGLDPQVLELIRALTGDNCETAAIAQLPHAIELGLVAEVAVHCQRTNSSSDDGDVDSSSISISPSSCARR